MELKVQIISLSITPAQTPLLYETK